LIGLKNKKTIIYKCIACDGVVAGIVELDAFIPVVADIVASNCVIAGKGEEDAMPVVADIVACNCGVVAGKGEADAFPVVVDIATGYNVVARNYINPCIKKRTSCCCESYKRNSIRSQCNRTSFPPWIHNWLTNPP
jgi:hypothetical protein